MEITNRIILKHLSKLYSIANNVQDEDKLLDSIEGEAYEMLEYINQVRRRRIRDERKHKDNNDKRFRG